MRKVLDRLRDAGVKTVVVGSPGAVDTHFFRPGQTMGEQPAHVAYNDTLAHRQDIDRQRAAENGLRCADVYAAMLDAKRTTRENRGPKYDVRGGDGSSGEQEPAASRPVSLLMVRTSPTP